MGIIQRQSIKGLAIYIIGAGIHVFTMIYFLPNFISEADFGVFRVCFSLIAIFGSIGILGIPALVIKSQQEFKSNHKILGSFNFVTFLIAFAGCVICFLALYASKNAIYAWKGTSSPYLLNYFYTIPIGVFFSILLFYFDAYSVSTFRLTAPSIVKEIIIKLLILIDAILLSYNYITPNTFFLIFAFSYGIGFLILFIYDYAIRDYRWSMNLEILKNVHFRHQFYPTFFIFIIGALGALMLNINEPFVYGLLGAQQTSIQSIAITLSSMLTIPYKPLSNILFPFMHDAWQKKDTEKLNKISLDSSKYLFAIGIFLFLLLWSNINNIFKIIPNQASELYWPLFIFCVGRLLDYTTGTSTELLYTAPSYRKMIPIMISVFLFSLICYWLLIPKFRIIGAAITFSSMLTLFNILKYYHLNKNYNLQFFSWSMIKIFAIGMAVYLLQSIISSVSSNWLVDAIFRSVVVCVLFLGSVFLLKIFPEINQVIKNKLLQKN
jgi:O-antigen/teichoic acid export membrane protein